MFIVRTMFSFEDVIFSLGRCAFQLGQEQEQALLAV